MMSRSITTAPPAGDTPSSGNLLKKLALDESGGETLEYALVTGLIVLGAIGVIQKVGVKVLARWQSLNSSM